MISSGKAGCPAFAQDIFLLHHVAGFDADLAHMPVNRDQARAMIEQYGVSVDSEILRYDDLAVIPRFDRIMLDDRQIESDVILLIDTFAVVNIGPAVGEE